MSKKLYKIIKKSLQNLIHNGHKACDPQWPQSVPQPWLSDTNQGTLSTSANLGHKVFHNRGSQTQKKEHFPLKPLSDTSQGSYNVTRKHHLRTHTIRRGGGFGSACDIGSAAARSHLRAYAGVMGTFAYPTLLQSHIIFNQIDFIK